MVGATGSNQTAKAANTRAFVYNASTGNLGINTTSPAQKLHVLGNLLVAAGSSTGQHITQKAYELNSGTLSWEGSAGQLFSITNNLTSGSIFSVNDVSGIPSIDVNANGTVSIAAYGGNLGVGITNPTSKLHVNGQITSTQANSTTTGGGQIYLNGATGNRIDFAGVGVAAPAFTTRSAGTKIVLYPNVASAAVDFGFGIETGFLWSSVADSTQGFKWYAGTTNIATLSGVGVLSIAGDGSTVYGPNSTWGQYLRVGGNGNSDTTNASVVTTDGNLHLDSKTGGSATFINYYKGTGGVNFGNGASGTVGSISSAGVLSVNSTITGTRLISNIATGTAPLSVTSTTVVPNLNTTYLNGYTDVQLAENLRANRNFTGGGTITVDASYNVLWSARFIVISNGYGSNFSTNGYFDITCPTSGTITGVGGAANVTATAAGIPLAAWSAIYYILPIGSGNGSVAANFRVAAYTGTLDIPSTWVLICVRNGDDSAVTFNNGIVLSASQSILSTKQATANTANTLVKRDGSGNFSAGTITATLSGSSTSVANAVTFNNGGSGAASGTTFNGSAAQTISYNTVGASPLAGSASLTTTGTVTSGTWSGSFGAVSGANLTSLTAGNLSGTIPSGVLGNSTHYIGTTAITLNRASASQSLTGINIDGSSGSCTGNAATATNLSTNRTNWSTNGTISAVVGQLAWKNFSNNHTIFDASASTSPAGGAVSNTNAQNVWIATYPTLMGWNGSNTYGVRVDSARISDSTSGSSASCTGNSATATTATNQSGGTVSATTINSSGKATLGGANTGSGSNAALLVNGDVCAYRAASTGVYYFGSGTTGSIYLYYDGTNFTFSGGTVIAPTFSGSGASLTTLNASNLSSGTVPTARLGTGTANNTTYLRGDNTWATVSGGATLTNDTTTNATYYPTFSSVISGTYSTAYVSNTKCTFNPSTGTLSATQFTSLSDVNKKKNIRPIENPIEITKKLEGVRFDWKDTDAPSLGVIAQEVEKVLPELVVESDGVKSVSYGNIVGVLIEAIKEQQVRIEE